MNTPRSHADPRQAATPQRAGVLTPATAMGDVLVDRLRAPGLTFEIERVD